MGVGERRFVRNGEGRGMADRVRGECGGKKEWRTRAGRDVVERRVNSVYNMGSGGSKGVSWYDGWRCECRG